MFSIFLKEHQPQKIQLAAAAEHLFPLFRVRASTDIKTQTSHKMAVDLWYRSIPTAPSAVATSVKLNTHTHTQRHKCTLINTNKHVEDVESKADHDLQQTGKSCCWMMIQSFNLATSAAHVHLFYFSVLCLLCLSAWTKHQAAIPAGGGLCGRHWFADESLSRHVWSHR